MKRSVIIGMRISFFLLLTAILAVFMAWVLWLPFPNIYKAVGAAAALSWTLCLMMFRKIPDTI